MRYDDSIEQSAEYLRLALPLMSRQKAALTPVSYAIWYEYVAGINPALREQVDALTANGQLLDDAATVDLFRRYVSDLDHETAQRVGQGLQQVMLDVSESAANAGNHAGMLGKSLEEWSADISQSPDPSTLATAHLSELLEHTRNMQDSVATLKTRLDESQKQIEDLRQEVDRAREVAMVDALTGLANRRGFDLALAASLENLAPNEAGPSLIIADIDHFKHINDRYGHLFGDKVIRAVSTILRENVKGRDTAARYGGEEFILLLPHTPIEGAHVLAEQIRTMVEACRIKRQDNHEPVESVTISLGVARHKVGESTDELLTRADRALYASKDAGRNRTTISLPDSQ